MMGDIVLEGSASLTPYRMVLDSTQGWLDAIWACPVDGCEAVVRVSAWMAYPGMMTEEEITEAHRLIAEHSLTHGDDA